MPLFRRSRFVSELGPGDTVITPASVTASMAEAMVAAVSTSVLGVDAYRTVAYNVFPFTRDANVYYSATYAGALYFSAISPLSGDEARKRAVFSLLFSLSLSAFLSHFLPLSAREFAPLLFFRALSSSPSIYLFVTSSLLRSPLRFHPTWRPGLFRSPLCLSLPLVVFLRRRGSRGCTISRIKLQ